MPYSRAWPPGLFALNADLVMHSADYKYVVVHAPFSQDRIAAVLADPAVESAEGVRAAVGLWRIPETGAIDQILIFGLEPSGTAFNLPELKLNRAWLALPTTVLYDHFSLPQFGDIEGRVSRHEACPVEINGLHCEVRGLFQLGISFTANGQAFMPKAGFNRVFAGLPPYAESLGLIRLRPDAEPEKVRDRLQARLGPEMLVLTKKQLVKAEQRYWNGRTPVGFIIPVTLLVVVLVGSVIFYQILYTDVQHHLPEYATLKAIGFHDWNLQSLIVQQSMWLSLLGFPPGLPVDCFYPIPGSAGCDAFTLRLIPRTGASRLSSHVRNVPGGGLPRHAEIAARSACGCLFMSANSIWCKLMTYAMRSGEEDAARKFSMVSPARFTAGRL